MKKSGASQSQSASELISKRIAELGDWRGETLSRMRKLIKEADPDVVEEWKWMGTPIWAHDGIICTGESYKNVVKLTFLKGASLKDPARLFNSSLDGNARRAIDIHEGEEVDASAFKTLVRHAVALNSSGKSKPLKKAKSYGIPPQAYLSSSAPISGPSGRQIRKPSNASKSRSAVTSASAALRWAAAASTASKESRDRCRRNRSMPSTTVPASTLSRGDSRWVYSIASVAASSRERVLDRTWANSWITSTVVVAMTRRAPIASINPAHGSARG